MQACHVATPSYITAFIEQLRKRIQAPDFIKRHKRHSKDFTRRRKLPFDAVLLLLLQKTTQSIQRHLDDHFLHMFWVLHLVMPSPTAGAWTQARAKFKASALDELNYQMVVPFLYGPEHKSKLRLWHDLRLLAVDGTELNIPVTGRLAQRFRVLRSAPAKKPGWARGLARLSVLYDVLNRVALDAHLVSDRVGERKLALKHIGHMQPNDLVLMDCGYHGFTLLAALTAAKVQFVIRCSKRGFFEARKLFKENKDGISRIAVLYAAKNPTAECRRLKLPLNLKVRFVTVRLPDGKLEVLVTSLVDTEKFRTRWFRKLYHLRWGEETFYLLLKSRLDLENWTGLTLKAIEQDFAATVLLSNLESLLTGGATDSLQKTSEHTQHPLQPNRANCYHALKRHLLELLASPLPVGEVLALLEEGFLRSPVSRRNKRQAPRRGGSHSGSLNFQRYRKKVVF
jgi:hypothetical protein